MRGGDRVGWRIPSSFEEAFLISLIAVVILLSFVIVLLIQLRHARHLQQREQELRTIMTRELGHRIRNVISLIQSLSYQTHNAYLKRADMDAHCRILFEEAYEDWERKVVALGASHAVLASVESGRGSVVELADATLATFVTDPARIELVGPKVLMKADCLVGLNLVLHELATNSTKYGAWSNNEGCVHLSWEIDELNQLIMDWVERGGPPVAQPIRTGFGTTLIAKLALAQSQGTARLHYETAGLICHIQIPL
jgi:chemotaxis family two-component system sensor kinase Cph1